MQHAIILNHTNVSTSQATSKHKKKKKNIFHHTTYNITFVARMSMDSCTDPKSEHTDRAAALAPFKITLPAINPSAPASAPAPAPLEPAAIDNACTIPVSNISLKFQLRVPKRIMCTSMGLVCTCAELRLILYFFSNGRFVSAMICVLLVVSMEPFMDFFGLVHFFRWDDSSTRE